MNLKPKQIAILKSMASAGCTSPVSRQEIFDACEATGAYACPPSWLTQDSTRKVGRGLYECPELAQFVDSADSAPAPTHEENVVQTGPVGAVEQSVPAISTASLVMGMTGGDRDSLVPQKFNGYEKSALANCLTGSFCPNVEDGDILLFPPYLEHSVQSEPQHKSKMRMTFCFNIDLER